MRKIFTAAASTLTIGVILAACSSPPLSQEEKDVIAMTETCERKARSETHGAEDATYGDIDLIAEGTLSKGRLPEFDITFTHKSESWVEYTDEDGERVHREFLCATKIGQNGDVDSLWSFDN